MRNSSAVLVAAVLLTGTLACRREPDPRPAPMAAATPEPAVTPLTSRHAEGGAVPSTDAQGGAAHSDAPLPAGHPPVDHGGSAPAVDGPSISGTVDVAPALKATIEGGALFLIARDAKRQIVAVRRLESLKLPLTFSLSAADAMVQGTKFEGLLDVTARWSKSGDAMPSPGDIEVTVRKVEVPSSGLYLTLADVRK